MYKISCLHPCCIYHLTKTWPSLVVHKITVSWELTFLFNYDVVVGIIYCLQGQTSKSFIDVHIIPGTKILVYKWIKSLEYMSLAIPYKIKKELLHGIDDMSIEGRTFAQIALVDVVTFIIPNKQQKWQHICVVSVPILFLVSLFYGYQLSI